MKYDVKLSWDAEAGVWCTAVDTVGVYLCHESLPHLLSWTRDAVNDMLNDEKSDDLRFIRGRFNTAPLGALDSCSA